MIRVLDSAGSTLVEWGRQQQQQVQERFLMFADCSSKKREEIAQLIMDILEEHAIPLSDCSAQGYNNAANMAGKYEGA